MFLPKKLRAGFCNRKDTYTGKLAYVIYYDDLGKLRKEKSFESWRDKRIDIQEFTNEPTEGFVLNKKVGDYSSGWNHRSTYIRVYDPRGFEVEISVANLLYILRDCYCHPGKGLEGSFVYAWEGTELLLLSCGAKEYKEHLEKTKSLEKGRTEKKELKEGHIYNDSHGKQYVYLGKYWFSHLGTYYRFTKGKTSHVFISFEKAKEQPDNIMYWLLHDLKNLYGGDDQFEGYCELKKILNNTNYTKTIKEFDVGPSPEVLYEEYLKASLKSRNCETIQELESKYKSYIQSKEDFIENCIFALLSPDKKTIHILHRKLCYWYTKTDVHVNYTTFNITKKGALLISSDDTYIKDFREGKYVPCNCGKYKDKTIKYADLKKDYTLHKIGSNEPKLIFEDSQPRGT